MKIKLFKIKLQGGYDCVNQTWEVLQCNSLKTLDIVQKMDACNTLTTEICDPVFKRFEVCLDQITFNLTFFHKTNKLLTFHFDLKWLKVEDGMIAEILLSTWTVLQFKTPLDQYNKLQFNIQSHEYVTRWATEGRFLLPYAKTNFLKRTVTLWNLLPVSLIRITQRIYFKRQVKAHLGSLYS